MKAIKIYNDKLNNRKKKEDKFDSLDADDSIIMEN
jgi:hypothetical protein